MPQVLTTNALIMCPHGGQGTSLPTNDMWSVSGGTVLLENDMGIIKGCLSAYQCGGYQLHSMGLNTTKVDGRKVILVTDFNQTLTGLPLMMIESHTTIDNSTPAPLEAGGPVPPLTPAMLDVIPPLINATPTTLAFSITSNNPPVNVITFTLFSAFPLKWILTRQSLTQGTHEDLTHGRPSQADVTPSGGQWKSSSLTVSLKMTATYMASLDKGTHEFYMTGVSQRGLSGHQKAVLTVS